MSDKKKIIPVISVPSGYSLLDLLDTDDSIFEGEEPLQEDEVEVRYEQ